MSAAPKYSGARVFDFPKVGAGLSDRQVIEIGGEISQLVRLAATPHGNYERLQGLKALLAVEFGRRRGWRYCDACTFDLCWLSTSRRACRDGNTVGAVDHAFRYTENGRPRAIVGHLYPNRFDLPWLRHVAGEHDLSFEVLPTDDLFGSWYYPEACRAVVWTRAKPVPRLAEWLAQQERDGNGLTTR